MIDLNKNNTQSLFLSGQISILNLHWSIQTEEGSDT